MKTWATRYMRGKLRRLGVGVADSNADANEMTEGTTAVNPYLFLARHGMAVAGTAGAAAGGKKKLLPVPTAADSNGASTGNVASEAVPDGDDDEKRSAALIQ